MPLPGRVLDRGHGDSDSVEHAATCRSRPHQRYQVTFRAGTDDGARGTACQASKPSRPPPDRRLRPPPLAALVGGRSVTGCAEKRRRPGSLGPSGGFSSLSITPDTSVPGSAARARSGAVLGRCLPTAIAPQNSLPMLRGAARQAKRGNWSRSGCHKKRGKCRRYFGRRIGRFTVVEGRFSCRGQAGATIYVNFGRRWTQGTLLRLFRGA